MEENLKNNMNGYKMYVFTFIGLTILTLLAVGITQLRFSTPILITLVLLIAVLQALIILLFNMHLKFQDRILGLFTGIIFSLIFLTIIITELDYIF